MRQPAECDAGLLGGQVGRHWGADRKAGGGRTPWSQTRRTGDGPCRVQCRLFLAAGRLRPTSLSSCGSCPVLPALYKTLQTLMSKCQLLFPLPIFCVWVLLRTQKCPILSAREPERGAGGVASFGKGRPRTSGGSRSEGRGSQEGLGCLPWGKS